MKSTHTCNALTHSNIIYVATDTHGCAVLLRFTRHRNVILKVEEDKNRFKIFLFTSIFIRHSNVLHTEQHTKSYFEILQVEEDLVTFKLVGKTDHNGIWNTAALREK